jgi:hypothetical protein
MDFVTDTADIDDHPILAGAVQNALELAYHLLFCSLAIRISKCDSSNFTYPQDCLYFDCLFVTPAHRWVTSRLEQLQQFTRNDPAVFLVIIVARQTFQAAR